MPLTDEPTTDADVDLGTEDESNSLSGTNEDADWEVNENSIDRPVFKPHSQVEISESGEVYKARDSDTTATGEGESRGKALAELAAKLISGNYSDVEGPRLFDLGGYSDDEAAERRRRSIESMKETDVKKNKEMSFGE